jgi:hypothetical protein
MFSAAQHHKQLQSLNIGTTSVNGGKTEMKTFKVKLINVTADESMGEHPPA